MRPYCCLIALSSSFPLLLLRLPPVPLPRKAQESQKEMKLLLDMYKSAPKEQRDKVQLMAAERKAKAEVGQLGHVVLPRYFRALGQQVCFCFYSLTVWSKPVVVCCVDQCLRVSFPPMQVDDLRGRIRDLEERDRRESKKIADEDALRRIRQAEEQIEHLQRKLGATKQVKRPVVSLLLNAGIPLALLSAFCV